MKYAFGDDPDEPPGIPDDLFPIVKRSAIVRAAYIRLLRDELPEDDLESWELEPRDEEPLDEELDDCEIPGSVRIEPPTDFECGLLSEKEEALSKIDPEFLSVTKAILAAPIVSAASGYKRVDVARIVAHVVNLLRAEGGARAILIIARTVDSCKTWEREMSATLGDVNVSIFGTSSSKQEAVLIKLSQMQFPGVIIASEKAIRSGGLSRLRQALMQNRLVNSWEVVFSEATGDDSMLHVEHSPFRMVVDKQAQKGIFVVCKDEKKGKKVVSKDCFLSNIRTSRQILALGEEDVAASWFTANTVRRSEENQDERGTELRRTERIPLKPLNGCPNSGRNMTDSTSALPTNEPKSSKEKQNKTKKSTSSLSPQKRKRNSTDLPEPSIAVKSHGDSVKDCKKRKQKPAKRRNEAGNAVGSGAETDVDDDKWLTPPSTVRECRRSSSSNDEEWATPLSKVVTAGRSAVPVNNSPKKRKRASRPSREKPQKILPSTSKVRERKKTTKAIPEEAASLTQDGISAREVALAEERRRHSAQSKASKKKKKKNAKGNPFQTKSKSGSPLVLKEFSPSSAEVRKFWSENAARVQVGPRIPRRRRSIDDILGISLSRARRSSVEDNSKASPPGVAASSIQGRTTNAASRQNVTTRGEVTSRRESNGESKQNGPRKANTKKMKPKPVRRSVPALEKSTLSRQGTWPDANIGDSALTIPRPVSPQKVPPPVSVMETIVISSDEADEERSKRGTVRNSDVIVIEDEDSPVRTRRGRTMDQSATRQFVLDVKKIRPNYKDLEPRDRRRYNLLVQQAQVLVKKGVRYHDQALGLCMKALDVFDGDDNLKTAIVGLSRATGVLRLSDFSERMGSIASPLIRKKEASRRRRASGSSSRSAGAERRGDRGDASFQKRNEVIMVG